MTGRRKLVIAIGIVLAATAAVAAIGAGWLYLSFRGFGEFWEHGWLGPPEHRQRVELPDHGFAIAFAEDWVVETDPDPVVPAPWGVDPVVVAGPASGTPRCGVGVVPDGGSLGVEAFLIARAPDGYLEVGYTTVSAWSLPDDVVGIPFGPGEGDDVPAAAYWVPHGADALVVSCEVDTGREQTPDDEEIDSSAHSLTLVVGMPPIIGSIEPLPVAFLGRTDVSSDPDHRVETSMGVAVTLPEGWTRLRLEPDDDPQAPPPALAQLWPWRTSPGPTLLEVQPDEGVVAGGSCVLGGVALADYMRTWEATTLESIAELVDWAVTQGGQPEVETGPPATTYLELPAGRAARLDYAVDGVHRSVYVVPDDKTLHLLDCSGPAGQHDVWDAIARGIELSPAGAAP